MMDSPPRWYRERFATPPCKYRDRSVSLVRRYGRVNSPHGGTGIEDPLPMNSGERSFTKEVQGTRKP